MNQINLFRIALLALCWLLCRPALQAQQDPMYSQYMFNGLAINPAYAGSKDYLTAMLLHRSQWVDIDGAPVTNTFSLHTPLLIPNSAVGATVVHDRIGATTQTDAYAHYAYRIRFNSGSRLAFGLRGGLSHYKVDFGQLTYWDPNDELYLGGNQNGLAPNVGTGIYFDTRRFYAGVSVPRLISYDPDDSFSLDREGLPTAKRHYFFNMGYAIEAARNLVIKPSVMAKYEDAAPFQMDFNLNVLLADRVWLGASYRTGDAFVGMVEFIPVPMVQLGYAYDYTLSELRGAARATHEIILTFNLGSGISKLKTPRYF